jgi:hypothetical protein
MYTDEMAKKKRSKPMPNQTAQRPPRTGRAVNVWLPEDLGAAMDAYVASLRLRPTITSLICVALEEYLARQGHWPETSGS